MALGKIHAPDTAPAKPSETHSRRLNLHLLQREQCEGFDSRVSYGLLNGKIFESPLEAQILIKQWRIHQNIVGLRSDLKYRPPAPGSMTRMDGLPMMH